MKRRLFSALLVTTIIFGACNSAPEPKEITIETEEAVTEKAPVNPDKIAEIGISGMSCEMNCVSSIRKALLKMEGVATFEMEFDAEKDVNTAIVKFDSKAVSAEEMISTIEQVNDGIYKVENESSKSISEGGVNSSEANSAKESGTSISVFSLVDLVLNLF
jgi:copper chaperone CopZ